MHFADSLFARDKRLLYTPIDERDAVKIDCKASREFLAGIGISGEILHTPSHSADSISLMLDSGVCIVGDLEPPEYIDAYADVYSYSDNLALERDWRNILAKKPKIIYYSHHLEATIETEI